MCRFAGSALPQPYIRRAVPSISEIVKGNFSGDIFSYGIFSQKENIPKSRIMSKFIMLTKLHIHNRFSLWKTPVEKPVENVEKYSISTAISGFSPLPESVNGVHILLHTGFCGCDKCNYVAGK